MPWMKNAGQINCNHNWLRNVLFYHVITAQITNIYDCTNSLFCQCNILHVLAFEQFINDHPQLLLDYIWQLLIKVLCVIKNLTVRDIQGTTYTYDFRSWLNLRTELEIHTIIVYFTYRNADAINDRRLQISGRRPVCLYI